MKALAVRALDLNIALCLASASLRAFSSDFIPGAAIRQTETPIIAPPEMESHNGIPSAIVFTTPADTPNNNPMPSGFSATFSRVALPLIISFSGLVIPKKVRNSVNKLTCFG